MHPGHVQLQDLRNGIRVSVGQVGEERSHADRRGLEQRE